MKYILVAALAFAAYKFAVRPPQITEAAAAASPVLRALKTMDERDTSETRLAFYEELLNAELRGEGTIPTGPGAVQVAMSHSFFGGCREVVYVFSDEAAMSRAGLDPSAGFARDGRQVFRVLRGSGLNPSCVKLNIAGPGGYTFVRKELDALAVGDVASISAAR